MNDYQKIFEKSDKRWREFIELQHHGLIPRHGEYAPAGVHYPPITNYHTLTQEEAYKNYSLPSDGLFDIYIHIPFCKKRCLFCHYPSLYNAPDAKKDEYLDALEKEMDIFLTFMNLDKIPARSILMGGGTSTDLTPAQLKRLLTFFTHKVDLSKCKQFNYDVDPNTIVGATGIERLNIIKDFGGDRLTIGAQSFNEDILKKMNRSHGVDMVYESIENCKKFEFKINIELIYGHPGQTIENWIEVIEEAIQTDVDEIQLYRLKVEPYGDQEGTIKKFLQYHPDDLISVENTIKMKAIAHYMLAAFGYDENLRRVYTKKKSNISVYAYNQCCRLKDQIGFGLSAFSSLRDRFLLNTPSFPDYYKRINDGLLPVNRGLVRNKNQQIRWSTILPLKNYFIDKKLFLKINNTPIDKVFQKRLDLLKKHGLLEENNDKIALTSKGAFFSDEIVHVFYEKENIAYPIKDFNAGELNPYKIK